MPTDASIPLSVQPFRLNSAFDALKDVMALRGAQQNQELRDAQIQNEREITRQHQAQNAAADRQQRIDQLIGASSDLLDPPDPDFGTQTFNEGKVGQVYLHAGMDPAAGVSHIKAVNDAIAGHQRDLLNRFGEVGRTLDGKDADEQAVALGGLKSIMPASMFQKFSDKLAQTGNIAGDLVNLSSSVRDKQTEEGLKKAQTASALGSAAESVSNAEAAKHPKPPTAEADNARYMGIQQAGTLKQPVSAEDAAWAQAFEKQRGLTGAASAAAAAERQAATQGQQNAIQERGQRFQEQQAGRSELTNKVEQPYLDAKEKASTLRSVIDAAKGGNMTAANVQTLLGTLGLVTMEGVKRINTTELNQVGGAGSLLERLKGAAGGIAAGQPLSSKIQSDLQQLSDLLEQSASKKYRQGFDSVTKRYRLDDEKPLDAAPDAAPMTKAEELIKKYGGP